MDNDYVVLKWKGNWIQKEEYRRIKMKNKLEKNQKTWDKKYKESKKKLIKKPLETYKGKKKKYKKKIQGLQTNIFKTWGNN